MTAATATVNADTGIVSKAVTLKITVPVVNKTTVVDSTLPAELVTAINALRANT